MKFLFKIFGAIISGFDAGSPPLSRGPDYPCGNQARPQVSMYISALKFLSHPYQRCRLEDQVLGLKIASSVSVFRFFALSDLD